MLMLEYLCLAESSFDVLAWFVDTLRLRCLRFDYDTVNLECYQKFVLDDHALMFSDLFHTSFDFDASIFAGGSLILTFLQFWLTLCNFDASIFASNNVRFLRVRLLFQ